MGAGPVLVEKGLAAHIRPLFAEAGLETEVVDPSSWLGAARCETRRFCALVVSDRTRVSAELLDAIGESLEIIGVVGDSLGNLNVVEATRRGIIVKITAYGNTLEAASLAKRLMLLLVCYRPRRRNSRHAWIVRDVNRALRGRCTGFELAESVVGLVGCGRVAQALALMLKPHCRRVLGYDNHPAVVYRDFHRPSPLERPVIEYCQLEEIVNGADVVSIHTRGEEQTDLLDELFHSPRRPYMIDTARDSPIKQEALLTALDEGRIRGVALTVPLLALKKDVGASAVAPFLGYPNVVLTPQPGRPQSDAHKKNAKQLAAAVIAYLLSRDLSLAVNPPELFAFSSASGYPLRRRSRHLVLPLTP